MVGKRWNKGRPQRRIHGALCGKTGSGVGVGRSMCRHIGICHREPEPVSIEVNTLDTGEYADDLLTQAVRNLFDFRPEQIIWHLQLKEPLFALTTNYGHFGKEYLPWEQIDMAMRFRYEVEKLDVKIKVGREK